MELIYASERVEEQCTSVKVAGKLFGGDKGLALSLLSRVNALKSAETIKDIIIQPTFHFHKLYNKDGRNLEGFFAIDVKSRKDQWRIIIQPLDENKKPYESVMIDQIASCVRIVKIMEVSKHYE